MTEYFEILDRDGPARIGELRLSEPRRTPALVDDLIADAGSVWPAEREVPEGSEAELTVLPHRGYPAGTDDRVVDAFSETPPAVEYPDAVVLGTHHVEGGTLSLGGDATDGTADADGAGNDVAAGRHDAYVLSGPSGFVGHSAAFVETIADARRAIPDDAALYCSGVATPANVALLAYSGIDLFDEHRAVIAGTRRELLTPDGRYDLAECTEVPGALAGLDPAATRDRPLDPEDVTAEDCVAANVAALRSELATVRERIRRGRLRDYLERSVRDHPWQTAAMRRFDDEWSYLETHEPVFRNASFKATSEDTIRRVAVQRFAERVTERYENRFNGPLVLVPCSARKPYGDSQSHGQFHDAIRFRAHKVSLTSPLGIVPQELEATYPAQHYDTAVAGRWSATEIEFVADVLAAYLERNDYPRIVAHVPPEGYRTVCERAAEAAGVEMEYTVEDHPTTDASLGNLEAAVEGELKYAASTRKRNTVRAIADVQFGTGAGDDLLADVDVHSRWPKFRIDDREGQQLAAMVPQYGLLALTVAGARRWEESDVPTKHVHIDDFVPQGSVLAPGITDADESIRTGDEVVVTGPSAFGVGRARMPGPAMVESTRGEAVQVRHVDER